MNRVTTILVILLSLTQSHEIHMDLHLNKKYARNLKSGL